MKASCGYLQRKKIAQTELGTLTLIEEIKEETKNIHCGCQSPARRSLISFVLQTRNDQSQSPRRGHQFNEIQLFLYIHRVNGIHMVRTKIGFSSSAAQKNLTKGISAAGVPFDSSQHQLGEGELTATCTQTRTWSINPDSERDPSTNGRGGCDSYSSKWKSFGA